MGVGLGICHELHEFPGSFLAFLVGTGHCNDRASDRDKVLHLLGQEGWFDILCLHLEPGITTYHSHYYGYSMIAAVFT